MGKMNIILTGIQGLVVIEPMVYEDHRGYFMETYNQRDYAQQGLDMVFVQDNQSQSLRGVVRGLHYQVKHPQGKLVRALRGEVFDVAVDLRSGSATYGKWYGVVLSGGNRKQFYIPPGFAHGFVALSESAEFAYKCTDFYDPADEAGIRWDDPDIGIEWPVGREEVILSEKDQKLKGLGEGIALPLLQSGCY